MRKRTKKENKIMADNVVTDGNNVETTIDYEAEYKKVLAERDSYKLEAEKQKGLKDKYATENADYKRKAEAQMSEEEKRVKEQQEMQDKYKEMESKVAKMELEKDLLANGFTTEESEKLIKSNFAVKDIATIIKERVDTAVKSAQAEFTKNSTSKSLMGNGTADGQDKSDFQAYQESKKTTNNIVEL